MWALHAPETSAAQLIETRAIRDRRSGEVQERRRFKLLEHPSRWLANSVDSSMCIDGFAQLSNLSLVGECR
jgi:hypothetical protein